MEMSGKKDKGGGNYLALDYGGPYHRSHCKSTTPQPPYILSFVALDASVEVVGAYPAIAKSGLEIEADYGGSMTRT
jgi:hypothetical protein